MALMTKSCLTEQPRPFKITDCNALLCYQFDIYIRKHHIRVFAERWRVCTSGRGALHVNLLSVEIVQIT